MQIEAELVSTSLMKIVELEDCQNIEIVFHCMVQSQDCLLCHLHHHNLEQKLQQVPKA